MKESSADGKRLNRLRSWASSKVHGGDRSSTRRPGRTNDPLTSLPPISNSNQTTIATVPSNSTNSATLAPTTSNTNNGVGNGNIPSPADETFGGGVTPGLRASAHHGHHYAGVPASPREPQASAQAARKGPQLGPVASDENNEKSIPENESNHESDASDKPNVVKRFFLTAKAILCHSWINVLLVFVPAGIAVNFVPNMSPGVIFALNAIAIIPLAGLLSQATETVAHRMGDAIGALMNITFGNAVELIILYVPSFRRHANAKYTGPETHG